jgi:hypothetical protein
MNITRLCAELGEYRRLALTCRTSTGNVMKTMIAAAAFVATFFSAPAFAQNAAPPAGEAQAGPSTASVASARELLQFMLIDSGALELSMTQSFDRMMPQIRARLTSSPDYARLPQAQRDALLATFNNAPQIVREEMEAILPALLDDTAHDTAALFSESEMDGISDFLRNSTFSSAFVDVILQSVKSGDKGASPTPDLSQEQMRAVVDFARTPAGRAFTRNTTPWTAMIQRRFDAAGEDLARRVETRLMHDVCGVLPSMCAGPGQAT